LTEEDWEILKQLKERQKMKQLSLAAKVSNRKRKRDLYVFCVHFSVTVILFLAFVFFCEEFN
jgi:hypothetical protein